MKELAKVCCTFSCPSLLPPSLLHPHPPSLTWYNYFTGACPYLLLFLQLLETHLLSFNNPFIYESKFLQWVGTMIGLCLCADDSISQPCPWTWLCHIHGPASPTVSASMAVPLGALSCSALAPPEKKRHFQKAMSSLFTTEIVNVRAPRWALHGSCLI